MENQVLVDASTIMSVVVEEPGRAAIESLIQDKYILAPEVLPFEIGNALTKLMKRKLLSEEQMQEAFDYYTTIPIDFLKINIREALKIAWKYSIYSYDAYYLEVSKRLGLPLITLDGNMKKNAINMGILILEV